MERQRILMVPSAGIESLNRLPRANTLLRCQVALEEWKQGGYDAILVTGGVFNPANVQTVPAALLMRDWFMRQGVPAVRILVEAKSVDTYENVAFGMGLLASARFVHPEIVVVSHWQHVARIRLIFYLAYGLRIGRRPIYYPLPWREVVNEFLYLGYTALDPYGTGEMARNNREARRRAAQGDN